jgi:hypothetical protein
MRTGANLPVENVCSPSAERQRHNKPPVAFNHNSLRRLAVASGGRLSQRLADRRCGSRSSSPRPAIVASPSPSLADAAFALDGATATRAQRLSATRAGHRLIRRMKEADERRAQLIDEAHREAEVVVGPGPSYPKHPRDEAAAYKAYAAADKCYQAAFKAAEPYRGAEKLLAFVDRFGSWMRFIPLGRDTFRGEREFWRATADGSGTLYFLPPDVPIRVWAVSIHPSGVIWAEVEAIERISEMSVSVRYAGETARLDREKLWRSWALWRGVTFVSSRSGAAASLLDAIWRDRWGRAAGTFGGTCFRSRWLEERPWWPPAPFYAL